MELTSKALTALAHSGQPPVTWPLTSCEDLSVHTYSIITHADGEIGIAENHFDLDVAGLCMLVRVADCFAYDATSLITDDKGQLPRPAFYDYTVLRH